MDMPENNNKINITEDVIVELQYPTYDSVMGGSLAKIKEDPLEALKIMAKNIVAIYTKEERIDAKNEKLEDLENFLTSMTSTQLQNLMTFFNNLPALKHKAVFSCEKCQTVNELELKGIADFF
jgi:hypothetical protein